MNEPFIRQPGLGLRLLLTGLARAGRHRVWPLHIGHPPSPGHQQVGALVPRPGPMPCRLIGRFLPWQPCTTSWVLGSGGLRPAALRAAVPGRSSGVSWIARVELLPRAAPRWGSRTSQRAELVGIDHNRQPPPSILLRPRMSAGDLGAHVQRRPPTRTPTRRPALSARPPTAALGEDG